MARRHDQHPNSAGMSANDVCLAYLGISLQRSQASPEEICRPASSPSRTARQS